MLADSDMVVWVSAASAWEIATKVRIGKMPGAEHLVVDFGEYLRRWYASALEIEAADALHAGVLDWGIGTPSTGCWPRRPCRRSPSGQIKARRDDGRTQPGRRRWPGRRQCRRRMRGARRSRCARVSTRGCRHVRRQLRGR